MEKGSSLPRLERHSEKAQCPRHGEYTAEYLRIGGNSWLGGYCPQCTQEQQRQEDERIKERESNARFDRLLAKSGIPARYRDVGFRNFEVLNDQASSARDGCVNYTKQFKEKAARGENLVLSGSVGTGKTHLGCAIVQNVIAMHDLQAVYTTVAEAAMAVKCTFNPEAKENESDVMSRFTGVDLLVLDEVGTHETAYEQSILFKILDARYREIRPTVILTNLEGWGELSESIGERMVDRLREVGSVIMLRWQSHRMRSDGIDPQPFVS